ncbi:hypothetical protein J437_LFUL008527, partial [Ladona fulva]
ETRWKGNKAKELAEAYKLIYSGTDEKGRNGVGVIIDKELKGGIYEVKRKSDRIMCVKLEIGRGSTTIVCGYAPQDGCEEEKKNVFWRQLDQVIMEIPENERVIVGEDLNGHVGRRRCGEERAHGRWSVGERNGEGERIMEHAEEALRNKFKEEVLKELRLPEGVQEWWEINSNIIRKAGEEILGKTSGKGPPEEKETWWWNEEVQKEIKEKKEAKKRWDLTGSQEDMETWKEYFHKLLNEENSRGRHEDGEASEGVVQDINKKEVEGALRKMKNGKAVGVDQIPAEV